MVEFASRLSYGAGMLDWQERINTARMREERADKLRAAMKKNGVAACLLEREDNIRYATGLPGDAFMPGLRYCLSFSLSTNPFYGSMRAGMNEGTNGPG
jgi:methyl coenzyme M reductase beta subunit